MSKKTKIRWVIAHEPIKLFFRAAKDFEASLNAQQGAEEIEIEIMTPAEYSDRYNDGIIVTKHDLLDLMDQGKIEMSQMYTTWMAETYVKDMLAFEMPFIFQDHDHATRVLEGEVGEQLLDRVYQSSKSLRALSYTYSGGFRCLMADKEVTTLADLSGVKFRSNRNPIAQATLKCIGIEPFVCELEETKDRFEDGAIEGVDTVYPRVYPLNLDPHVQTVIHSEHTLFLTTMLISDKFWNTLTPQVRSIIKRAAIEAGRKERAETIKDGRETKERMIAEGKTVVEISEQDDELFRQRAQSVYAEFADFFEAGLLDKIKKS